MFRQDCGSTCFELVILWRWVVMVSYVRMFGRMCATGTLTAIDGEEPTICRSAIEVEQHGWLWTMRSTRRKTRENVTEKPWENLCTGNPVLAGQKYLWTV